MKKPARWLAAFCLVALLTAPAAQAAEPGWLGWDLGAWLQSLWTAILGESDAVAAASAEPPSTDSTTTDDGDAGPGVDPLGLQSPDGSESGLLDLQRED